MFSFFKKNKISVEQVQEEPHFRHWYSLFGNEIERLLYYLDTQAANGKKTVIYKDLFVSTSNSLRAIINGNTAIAAFPYWKSTHYVPYETQRIFEYTRADNLEAIIFVAHPSGYAINFFATDYALNKEIYKTQKKIFANITAFAYIIEESDMNSQTISHSNPDLPQNLRFGDDFCAYVPEEFPDEISFFGKIQEFKEHILGDISGFIITTNLTPDFTIDIFIAQKNLTIILEKGKNIAGYLWIIGTLEK